MLLGLSPFYSSILMSLLICNFLGNSLLLKQDLRSCYWTEAIEDDLEWILASVDEVGSRGPHQNFQNATDGKFAYVDHSKQPSEGIAEIITPLYQDTNTKCLLKFYVYILGKNL